MRTNLRAGVVVLLAACIAAAGGCTPLRTKSVQLSRALARMDFAYENLFRAFIANRVTEEVKNRGKALYDEGFAAHLLAREELVAAREAGDTGLNAPGRLDRVNQAIDTVNDRARRIEALNPSTAAPAPK